MRIRDGERERESGKLRIEMNVWREREGALKSGLTGCSFILRLLHSIPSCLGWIMQSCIFFVSFMNERQRSERYK